MKLKDVPEKEVAVYDHVLKYVIPFIPKKIKPNHLTFFRLVFSPVVITWLAFEQYFIGLILFVILALTDMFDGSMARIRKEITTWGKIWDPIADKLLVGGAVVVLLLKVNLVLTILVLAMELSFIIGGAFHRMSSHTDIQANIWGKIKMNLQCFGIGFILLGLIIGVSHLMFFGELLFYISLFFALMSIFRKGI
ncbi:CDP-diacylglycerol--glycerol-3-phosphate 3-phosphatidyltransferase [Candidatus Falkowbacteria bacterium]|jgi:CDP-diacylglycerol--glycerol-3-phosphate 3-phosphatidyltransferase|nr:CDP-diacylglycerol--glycerol-3-phosphate 3-phosphatidyltransferase [Candidatus Falkowbacteria bacterium]MBT7007521.1 CDP-diacylglycerol--glycerol-3-phosphate 3-phosphatidyltransferase [Candidatus Falkowbacteria bacterium]